MASFLYRLPLCDKHTPSNITQTRRWPFDNLVGGLMPLTGPQIITCLLFGLGSLLLISGLLEKCVLSRLILGNRIEGMSFPKGRNVGQKKINV